MLPDPVTTGRGAGSNVIESQTTAHPESVEVLADLIAELDRATEAGEFYDHVCEALCRLTPLERAGILLYDPTTRAVRAVGSHGVDKGMIGEVEGTLDETPIAQRALAENRVVVAAEMRGQVPERYAQFAGISTITCTPVAAGGRWFGVIFADQGGGRFEPTGDERETMLTFGRLAALAASVERATRQEERTHRLDERVGLVRDIHERVMQRLFGVTLALGAEGALADEERRTCHDELQKALGDLRSALVRPAGAERRAPRTTLRELVGRRAERTPQLTIDWRDGVEVPEALESLSQSVFLETLRNCEKHARAERIDVRVDASEGAFELEVTNDGITSAGAGAGLGLRLLTLEALQEDALVEFGPLPEGRWHVRMVGPVQ